MIRATPAAVLLVAVALTLAACSQPAAAPTAWQASVETVAQQASSGDVASALASLNALEADVIAQRDAGALAPEEADGILTRIATVRADLTALLPTPTPTAAPVPAETTPQQEPTSTVDDGSQDDGGSQGVEPGSDDGSSETPGEDETGKNKDDKQKDDKKDPKDPASPGSGKNDG